MTITEAAVEILDEFGKFVCSYDSHGNKVITWVVENRSDYDFERYWANIYAYDENDVIIKTGVVYVEYLPAKAKQKVIYRVPSETCNIHVSINEYEVMNLDKSNKEEHIADLYRANVLDYEEYKSIQEYLFSGVEEIETGAFLCRNPYERKIAAVKYLKERGIFEDDEVEKILKCIKNKR